MFMDNKKFMNVMLQFEEIKRNKKSQMMKSKINKQKKKSHAH